MHLKSPQLTIGARGWRYEHWTGSFYPDDLPEDWWFSYYSNEFRSVLVPYEYLENTDASTLQGWIDDADEAFQFFLELPLWISLERLLAITDPLAPQLGGILMRDLQRSDAGIQESSLSVDAIMEKARQIAPLIVDWQDLDNTLRPLAERYHAGCYWQPQLTELDKCSASVAVAEISQSNPLKPKTLKKIIEHCFSVQGPSTIGLFLGGNSPYVQDIRTATMISQMMA